MEWLSKPEVDVKRASTPGKCRLARDTFVSRLVLVRCIHLSISNSDKTRRNLFAKAVQLLAPKLLPGGQAVPGMI